MKTEKNLRLEKNEDDRHTDCDKSTLDFLNNQLYLPNEKTLIELPKDDNEVHPFDLVMEKVGSHGRYQKRFYFLFNIVFVFLVSMPNLNFIVGLAIPEHWCHVPGRNGTNYTLEEWKNIHIPTTEGLLAYEKCTMFNITWEGGIPLQGEPIGCQFGWEYDRTWYDSTAASDHDWVCDNDGNVAKTFMVARIGEVVGCIILGQLGDIIGRRPIYFVTIVIIVVGRTMSALTAEYYYFFLAAAFIGSFSATSIFSAPMVVAMEISRNEDRAFIAMMQNCSWTISIAVMPLIMWIVRDWIPFMLISTIPCALFLLLGSYLCESPRWLAGCGKTKQAIIELEKIAKVNKTSLPEDTALLLRKAPGTKEEMYGVLALFSSARLAKNTIFLVLGWIITVMIYLTLTLNVNNLGGNPYMNYFLQGLAEFPAYVLGKYSSDSIGRRWTNIGAFCVTSLACIPIIFTVGTPGYEITTSLLAVFIKFSVSFAWFVVNLQSLETYPTCVRQTGISLGAILANAFGVLCPVIVYLGAVNPRIPYIVSCLLCIGGAICGIFLPETLNQQLPETLTDAQQFGENQPFWYFPGQIKKKKKTQDG